jgi:hypothetical protein
VHALVTETKHFTIFPHIKVHALIIEGALSAWIEVHAIVEETKVSKLQM